MAGVLQTAVTNLKCTAALVVAERKLREVCHITGAASRSIVNKTFDSTNLMTGDSVKRCSFGKVLSD
jgi:hypothetical protein